MTGARFYVEFCSTSKFIARLQSPDGLSVLTGSKFTPKSESTQRSVTDNHSMPAVPDSDKMIHSSFRVDLGQGIRSRATHICSLVRNEESYRSARERAQERLGRNLQGFGSSRSGVVYTEKAECFLERAGYAESETWEWKDNVESIMAGETSELVPQVGDSPEKRAAQVRAFFNRGRENTSGLEEHDRALLETRGEMGVTARQKEERKRGPSNAGAGNAEPLMGALPFDGGRVTADPAVDSWLYKGTDIRALRPLLAEAGATLPPGSGWSQSPEGASERTAEAAGETRFFASLEPSRSRVARVGRGPQEGNCKSASVLEAENRAPGPSIEPPEEDLITWDDEKGETASISYNPADTARDCAQRNNEGPGRTLHCSSFLSNDGDARRPAPPSAATCQSWTKSF
jgi:hypothetical protein